MAEGKKAVKDSVFHYGRIRLELVSKRIWQRPEKIKNPGMRENSVVPMYVDALFSFFTSYNL